MKYAFAKNMDLGNLEDDLEIEDKLLYHQIHPLKLATDWISAFVGLYLLGQHQLVLGVLLIFVPATIASFLLIRFSNLNKYRRSSFGKYVARYMTPAAQLTRLLGFFVMTYGAWFHVWYAVPAGFLVILLAWFRGKIVVNSGRSPGSR